MTTQTESHRFEAEVQELLGLMIHSLYTQKDIFLRELISNASDALDKLRLESLTDKDLLGEDEELAIRIEVDAEAGTLSVVDNGIGMSREELAENLGTIARSGTRQFVERLKKDGGQVAAALIGQFGVGFYSSFMVADEVVVESRKAGETGGSRWRSTADGTYTLEDLDPGERGTRVRLHLKPRAEEAEGEQGPDFLDRHTLSSIVKQHSDFVEYPIRMEMEEYEVEKDEEGKPREGAEPRKVLRVRTLNSQRPLWARAKEEITEEEHAEFYRHIAHDWGEPAKVLHLRAEVPVEYTALLYVPKQRQMDFLEGPENKSRIALYVRRVLIMPDCTDLLPAWLRFVRGVVECPDLPLNISRQTLQSNPLTRRIRRHLVSKVLGALGEMLEKDRQAYQPVFEHHGRILKEGIYHGEDEDHRISKLCLFASTKGENPVTLDEYVERMPVSQKAIYYIAGMDRETVAASPHLEAFRAKDTEVLLMTDPVDEWWLPRLREFRGKSLRAVDRGELDLDSEDEKKAREERQEAHKGLLETMQQVLGEDVAEVRFTSRLKDSPAVLVSAEGAASPALERVLREVHGDIPKTKRILELNPDHPLVARLENLHEQQGGKERVESYAKLLYGQALLTEGSPLPDPAAFAALLTELMVGAAGKQA